MSELISEKEPDGDRMRAILVVVATMGFATSPVWSAGFGGFDPDSFPYGLEGLRTQPAGYAFSIWGVIYLWLLISAVVGLFRHAEDAAWDAGRWWLIASLVLGTPWISVAMSSPVWATILLFGMLATALRALWLSPLKDRWALRLPLALYAGWLTAAAGVSLSVLSVGYGLGQSLAVAVLLAAVLGGLAMQMLLKGAPTYGGAVAWGLLGVAVKNLSSGGLGLAAIAFVLAALLLFVALRSEMRPG